jgi:ligand-binding sensor domain-containing protein
MQKNLILTFLLFSSIFFSYGQDSKIYDKSNSNLVDNDLLSVTIDKNGNIWIGTSKFGLIKFDGEKFTTFNKDNSKIKGKCISPVFADSKGNVWVSFSQPNDGLATYDGSVWTVFTEKDVDVEKISVISICEDKQGTLYFGGSNGLVIYQNEKWSKLAMPRNDIIVRSIDIDTSGTIAIGHNSGLLIYKNEQWKEFTTGNSEISLGTVRAVKYKTNGELFVGYGGGFGDGGFSIVKDNNWTHYNKTNSKVPDHMVRDIEFDGKNYWMATNNGVIQLNNKELKPILFREGMFKNTILDIAIENGVIWVATNFGLIKYVP